MAKIEWGGRGDRALLNNVLHINAIFVSTRISVGAVT